MPQPSIERVHPPVTHTLRDHLVRTFRNLVVGSLSTVFVAWLVLLFGCGIVLVRLAESAQIQESARTLKDLTEREAAIRDVTFADVARIARRIQRTQERHLSTPRPGTLPSAPTFVRLPAGHHVVSPPQGLANVSIPLGQFPTPTIKEDIRRTAAFDEPMADALHEYPTTLSASYFMGANGFTRILVNGNRTIDETLDDRQYDYYQVAAKDPDPSGAPRWTHSYLDPAGLGWMVSCAVPVRHQGRLVGVTGFDVPLRNLLRVVTERPLVGQGMALLADGEGMAMAVHPHLARLLELGGELDDNQAAVRSRPLPESRSLRRVVSADLRQFFTDALITPGRAEPRTLAVGDRRFVVTRSTLQTTGWQLFVFTPETAILAPLATFRTRCWSLLGLTVVLFGITLAVAVGLVLSRASRAAGAIAAPLREVTDATGRLGSSLATRPLHHVGIHEIDDLTTQFARMTRELVQREEALVEAAVTRSLQERSHELLCKALPPSIVDRMMGGTRVIADSFDSVTILFADVVGFTPLAARRSASEIVSLLDRIFLMFDEIAERHGLEKIKTIGDAYMAVAGAPDPVPDHAERVARVALDMHRAIEALALDPPMQVRIGLHSGPAVAGVIGKNKVLYDLWGSTVNLASRLESHGAPGQTHVSDTTAQLLPASFVCQPRGPVHLKGVGEVQTCWLLAEQVGTRSPQAPGRPEDPLGQAV